MTEQGGTPPHLDSKYLGLLKGTCPNTGERCEALGDLRFNATASSDSLRMGIGEGSLSFDSMTVGQREAYSIYTEKSQERAVIIQQILGGRCIDSCTPQEAS